VQEFVPLATAVALMWKIVDFAKHCRVRDVNAVVTQLATWSAGVVVTLLLAWSDWGDKVPVASTQLGKLNGASLVLFGLSLGATASVGYDLKRAIDNNDSAAMPALVTGAVPITPPATVSLDAVSATDARDMTNILAVSGSNVPSAQYTSTTGWSGAPSVTTGSYSTAVGPDFSVAAAKPKKKAPAKKTSSPAKKTTARKTTRPKP
jgi:hypothetical protein